MKKVTKHYVTIEEIHVEYPDAPTKDTLERRVKVNDELVHAERYPIRCIDKFAQPELQAFIQVLSGYVPKDIKTVHLSRSFYKKLCVILVCIWLITILFFLQRLNLSV